MKQIFLFFWVAVFGCSALLASDKKEYQIGVLKHHTQNTVYLGTETDIHCSYGSCTGSTEDNYQTRNWWNIRVEGGYWELQPNWQFNDKHNPLNTAKEGDKVLFRMGRRHYLNGTQDVAYLPRTDDPNKEVMLLAVWRSDTPPPSVQPKSQMQAACEKGKLTAEQQKQYCGTPEQDVVSQNPPAQSATPETPLSSTTVSTMDLNNPMIQQYKQMCDSGMYKTGVFANQPFYQQQCERLFPPQQKPSK